MGVDVVGYGLSRVDGLVGWSEVLRSPVTPKTSLRGLTARTCAAVHDLGYWGAEVRIEQREPACEPVEIDRAECSCPLCQSGD